MRMRPLNTPEGAAVAAETLNGGPPALVVGPAPDGTVTLVEGSTFCLSDGAGDITPGGAHGLYFRDTRVISRLELRADGQRPGPLSARSAEAFTALFVSRLPPRAVLGDSTLLITRERLIGDGLRETITVHNTGRETTAVLLVLYADADFADLFAVKAGRAGPGAAEASASGSELLLRDRADGTRGVAVRATSDPVALPGALTWRALVPARGRWTTEVTVQPALGDRRVRPQFRPGQRAEASGPGRKIRAWRTASTVITAEHRALAAVLARTEDDLGALLIRDAERGGRPFVAAGAPWYMTLFGRDSLLTAWMALPLEPALALGTLQTLAGLQGTRADPVTEEEPGRILHELRQGPEAGQVMGGSRYYGTADATPLFVMLLGEAWRWGADPAAIRALMPAADAALAWIEHYGDRDGDGFVEYQRATDRGLVNQGWKDSFDSITDAGGRILQPPIALCEVQGYAYAAWLARAELASAFGQDEVASRCRTRAEALRDRFAESFYLPALGWYALALDGSKHPADALASNPAHCLWTGIATDEHAAALIARLAGPDMDSGYGLRTLSADMAAYNPMSYHNGSVWPHDTALAVAGLMRYAHLGGAADLARRLAAGLLDAAAAFGGRLPELFCGFPRAQFSPPVPYPTSCSPQAWASAAPLLLLRALLGLHPDVPRRTVTLRPALPPDWGAITLRDLRLGDAVVDITATGGDVRIDGLPSDWTVVTGSSA
jgi:glycogen debranching enzyme